MSENIHLYGGDASRLTVSGHSAGAHLATFLLTEGEEMPRGALLLGGVYNLRPLRQSFLQPLIQLTDDEVCQFSPIDKHFQPRVDAVILYGERGDATVPRAGSRARLADKEAGCDVSPSTLTDTDHMSSVLDLGFSDREAGAQLFSLISRH